MPRVRAASAAPVPTAPRPMISAVFPGRVPVWIFFQVRSRWYAASCGSRVWRAMSPIRTYSKDFFVWTPLAVINLTPAGSQSRGYRWSTPAPMSCTQRSLGARAARPGRGNFQPMSTSASRTPWTKLASSFEYVGRSRRKVSGKASAAVSNRSRSSR